MVEAHWANSFVLPDFPTVAGWSMKVLPFEAASSIARRARIAWRSYPRSPIRRVLACVPWVFLWLISPPIVFTAEILAGRLRGEGFSGFLGMNPMHRDNTRFWTLTFVNSLSDNEGD